MQQRYAPQQVQQQMMVQQNTTIPQQNHQIYAQQPQNLMPVSSSGVGMGTAQQMHGTPPSGASVNPHQQYIQQQQMMMHQQQMQQQMGGSMMQVSMQPIPSGMQPIMGIMTVQQPPQQQSVAAHIQQQTHQLAQTSQIDNVCCNFVLAINFFVRLIKKQ